MKRQLGNLESFAWRTVLCGVWLLVPSTVLAESPNKIVQLEEHWELTLQEPEPDRSAPQITMVMSPKNDLDSAYFLFTMNHATAPGYQPGGLQVQVWEGESLVDSQAADQTAALSHSDEVVTWVQRLSLANGTLTFQVVDGASQSWGSFGGDDLALSVTTSLSSLNGYRPAVSLTESEVGFADNRVASLVLKKLVWVTEDGTVHEQSAPIPIETTFDQ